MIGRGDAEVEAESDGSGPTTAIREEVDVAIIGNGPSATFLSLMLSGYTPFYNGCHPNPFLAAKLRENPEVSLIDQDLQYLSDGLEGRSKNPISLLFDTLVQPNADVHVGESSPSSLNWTQEPCKAISHVVLGKGRPGGSWHHMQPEVQSLSTGRWLQLPIYQYQDWQKEFGSDETTANSRVSLGSVAKYYEHYVKKMGIEKNFINDVTVTQVCVFNPRTQYRSQSCESTFSSSSVCSSEQGCTRCSLSPEHTRRSSSPEPTYTSEVAYHEPIEPQTPVKEDILSDPESEPCKGATVCDSDDTGISCCAKHVCLLSNRRCWVVHGRKIDEDGCEVVVSVCAKNLVLATGVSDVPKKLNVPGENLDYVQHAFSKISPNNTAPILVVGAGLSAADAVLHVLSNRLPVIHAFHQDASDHKLIYHNMDPKMYSEYVRLFQLMHGKCSDPYYTPLPQHTVEKFSPQGVCTLKNNKDHYSRDIVISQAFVLIGGQANLEFLPECMSHQLGVKPDQPIEPKKNPMYLDAYTFEAEQFPSLYAMGPLAGDNFVRFVLGGALGITKHLREKLAK